MAVALIRPEEVLEKRHEQIPDVVFETINRLIIERFNGKSARIEQKEIVESIVAAGHKREDIFKRHWLDIEDLYRAQGWKVGYDRPGYCESYEPSFSFSKDK